MSAQLHAWAPHSLSTLRRCKGETCSSRSIFAVSRPLEERPPLASTQNRSSRISVLLKLAYFFFRVAGAAGVLLARFHHLVTRSRGDSRERGMKTLIKLTLLSRP
jgi:hypothetical protein